MIDGYLWLGVLNLGPAWPNGNVAAFTCSALFVDGSLKLRLLSNCSFIAIFHFCKQRHRKASMAKHDSKGSTVERRKSPLTIQPNRLLMPTGYQDSRLIVSDFPQTNRNVLVWILQGIEDHKRSRRILFDSPRCNPAPFGLKEREKESEWPCQYRTGMRRRNFSSRGILHWDLG